MYATWIEYNGKKIRYIDFSAANSEGEALKMLDEVEAELKASPAKVLGLSNYGGAVTTYTAFTNRMNQIGKSGLFKEKMEKSAVIGLDGIKMVFANAYQMFTGDRMMKMFKTKDEALDWLVQ